MVNYDEGVFNSDRWKMKYREVLFHFGTEGEKGFTTLHHPTSPRNVLESLPSWGGGLTVRPTPHLQPLGYSESPKPESWFRTVRFT